jgi:S-adenosylmethionine hydrolase
MYVGPDNGLFSFVLHLPDARAWVLNQPDSWLTAPSRTFHGRDIFAPVTAHLINGTPPAALGVLIDDPVRLPLPAARRHPDGELSGQVVHVDRFGNLITNVPGGWLAGARWTCEIGGVRVTGPSESYASADPGELLLLVSSNSTAEIAVREGSAAERLAVRSGATVRFWTS